MTRETLPLNVRVREAHLWYVRMFLARKLLFDLSRIVSKVAQESGSCKSYFKFVLEKHSFSLLMYCCEIF